jgi:YD repeat-containing protein
MEERWWNRSESRLGGSGFSNFNDNAEYTFGVTEGPNCIYGIQAMDYGDHRRIGTCVTQVKRDGKTWDYSYEQLPAGYKTTIVNPDSTTREVVTWQADTLSGVYSSKDELGRITSYEYGSDWRVSKQTLPDGQYTTYGYDSRGNLTEVKDFVYGSTTPWRTQLASYPASCTSANFRTCNKPDWVQDANGARTYYVYDPAHGGVTIKTGPADTNGVRPQTRYTYTAKYAQVKNGSGTLVNIGTLYSDMAAPIYKLTKMSTCTYSTVVDPAVDPTMLATCINPTTSVADAAYEQVKEMAYDHPNLLLTSETVRNGTSTVSATTSYAYDSIGNVTSVDGPRTDVDDTAYTTYDVLRRKEYEIGPDPDGSGTLPRQIVKHYYDSYGNETRTEMGTGAASFNSTTGVATVSGFTWSMAKKMTYGDLGMLLKTEVVVP